MIAGTHSGVGKTTVTAALCGAFRQLGLRVSVFKCGPDYLDPTYHLRAAGTRSQTLDGWMMGREGVLSTFRRSACDSDIALIEGVMGLFDGVDPTSNAGSTAEIARWLGAPVLLVIDTSGMSRSVAAMAAGFSSFDPDLAVAGVICNRIGSATHLEMLKAASTEVPVLGGLPKDAGHSFPSRHLGLHTADESSLPNSTFEAWAAHATKWCSIDEILRIARSASNLAPLPLALPAMRASTCRIGVARDEAFHFYYDKNLRLLENAGAELVEFSPINTTSLPKVDGLYLGGGYPEVHARALSDNSHLKQEIFDFCAAGKAVYAECGGLMYLCESIRQLDGSRYSMAGWFGAEAVMNERLQALGYVEVQTSRPTILGPSGQAFRGHQFRYSTLEWKSAAQSAYKVTRRRDGSRSEEGFCRENVVGSYVHAHWASNPSVAESFVQACVNYRCSANPERL